MSDYHNRRYSHDAEQDSAYSPEAIEYHHKRRERSNSSPEASSSRHSHTRSSFRRPRDPSPPHGPSSRNSLGSEDNLTLRRREANRLAAQRFRSRKKGYQDSLEEKVRQLEEDKELLVRKLTDAPDRPSRLSSAVTSPERRDATADVDVRVAALEAANRRLRDELRVVHEENDRLHEELDEFRRRDRETKRWERRNPHSLPPLDMTTPHARPTYPHSDSYTAATHGTAQSPIGNPHSATSPGFRLPPIRLALPGSLSAERLSTTSTIQSPFLPRPGTLDGMSLGPSPSSSHRLLHSDEPDGRVVRRDQS